MSRGGSRISQEDLNSLLDGELDPARLAQIVAAVSEHPELLERLERDGRIAKLLKRLNRDVLTESLPRRFTELIEADRRKRTKSADRGF